MTIDTSQTCSSPDGPKATIQAAINTSSSGSEIIVSDGTYTENIDFLGKAIIVSSENGPDVTTIDGNHIDRVVRFSSGEDVNSVLDGFTITSGKGGIGCWNSSPTITNCVISNNTANSIGGGGIYCYQSSPTITNCTINNNTANGICGSYTCGSGGGILCNTSSSPIITNCTISSNFATGTYKKGGGIYCMDSSSPTITSCTIDNNTAGNGGGINCTDYSSNESSAPTITNCTISGNTAYYNGGGIFFSSYSSSPPMITNCIISDNMANDYNGGGIYCSHTSLAITNCTISSNEATSINGGGIYCSSSSSPTVVNSILWGNEANGSLNEFYLNDAGSSITITYSDINPSLITGIGSVFLSDNINADPLFIGGGNYHLQTGSPCIDTGTDDTVTFPDLPNDDIDGEPRPWDGDRDGISKSDMGADEFVIGDVDGNGCVDILDVLCLYLKVIGDSSSCLNDIDLAICISCDIDGNENIDILDVLCLYLKVIGDSSSCINDVNLPSCN